MEYQCLNKEDLALSNERPQKVGMRGQGNEGSTEETFI